MEVLLSVKFEAFTYARNWCLYKRGIYQTIRFFSLKTGVENMRNRASFILILFCIYYSLHVANNHRNE